MRGAARTLTLVAALAMASATTHAQGVAAPVAVDATSPELPPTYDGPVRDVDVLLTVAADGHVRDVVADHAAPDELARAAVEAVSRTTFRPARRDGAPVAARIRLRVSFRARSEATEIGRAHV